MQRHNHSLVFPIYLAASPSLRDLLLGSGVPLAFGCALKGGLLAPIRAHQRLRAHKQRREVAQAERDNEAELRRLAAVEAKLLVREAAAKAREEEGKGGLVILNAIYGDVDKALREADARSAANGRGRAGTAASSPREAEGDEPLPDDDGWVRAGEGGAWLDVRVQLQYAVVDSMLRLPPKSKSALRGFSAQPLVRVDGPSNDDRLSSEAEVTGATAGDSVAREGRSIETGPCRLWVRYRIGSEIRTACVDDSEALQLGPS